MDTLTIQEGSQQITGDLEVLGSINNAGIDGIKTDVETAKGDLQIVASTVVEQWASLADDAVITTAEKKTIRDVWHGAETEYPLIHARGVEAGVPVAGYEAAYEALRVYLYGEPGILLDMATPSDVDRAEYTAAFGGYTEQRETLLAAVGTVAYETAELAGMYLTCSTDQVERNRAGTLSPAAITAYAYHSDGTAYAGRFVIEITTGPGLPWTRIDASEEDEESHETTIPGAIGDNLTTSARISVYMAGGETALLKMLTIPIVYAATVAPVYLGAFSTVAAWPTEGVLDGDYILDTRQPVESGPAEGGAIRRMTPTGWAEYLMTDPGYQDAFQRAKLDLMVWAKTYGVTTIAAVNAIFRSVAASQAFIDELKTVEVEITGTLKTGSGASDNARVAIQDSVGVISNTFSGSGTDDLAIIAEGATAGTVVVEIAEAQVGDTGPSGGKIVSLAPVIEASPSDLADSGWDAAVAAAAAANIGGKSDWALPTRAQLQAIRTQFGSTMRQGRYWTSEASGEDAYVVDMAAGAEELLAKSRGAVGSAPISSYGFYAGGLYEGKLYLLNRNTESLVIYDLATETQTIRSLSFSGSWYSAVIINGKLVSMRNTTELLVYDIDTDTETYKTTPVSLSSRGCIAFENKAYILPSSSFDGVVYDVANDTFSVITFSVVMSRRTGHVYNGSLYSPEDLATTNGRLEIYNLTTGVSVIKPLSSILRRLTSILYGGKIYMPSWEGKNTMEVYDIAADALEIKILPSTMGRACSVLSCGKIYMPDYNGNRLEIYDIASGTAELKTLLNTTRRYLCFNHHEVLYMPSDSTSCMDKYSIPFPSRPIRTNTETKRWTHALDAGAPVAHGPIVAGAVYPTAIDIKVSWPALAGHIVGDTWTIVQDSMIGMSVQDPDGVEYLRAADGAVECLINQGGTPTMARIGAGIIESGYVSGRGWYVKYGDGTMEQWGTVEGGFNAFTIQNANIGTYGWSYYSSGYTAQPYRDLPTPFYDTDYSIVAQQGSTYSFPVATTYSVAQFRLTLVSYNTSTAPRVHWHAKGRWRA